jgi:hypothetical protein
MKMKLSNSIFSKIIINVVLSLISLLSLLSCASSKPYEVKSPCVSKDSDNPYHRSPCSKRPANSSWEIS